MSEVQDADFTVEEGGEATEPGMALEVGSQKNLSREVYSGMLRPVAKPDEIMEVQEEVRTLIEKALKDGRDYGVIKGTKRPTLLKPGSERVCAAFGCAPRFSIMEKEIDHDRRNDYMGFKWGERKGEKIDVPSVSFGLYRYVLLCEIIDRASGAVVGSGVGSCSSLESKYISRPRDVENTILKMAKKRAQVDATLTTFGLSDQFTQDVEDMPKEAFQNGGGQSNGNSGGGSSQDWSLDSNTVGKNKAGETWRETCQSDPGYVEWSVGRVEGKDGMRVLDEAKRKVLCAELDRLAAENNRTSQDQQGEAAGSPPSAPSDDDHLHALRANIIETGKHKDKSWLVVAKDDFTYLDKAQNNPWGEKMLTDPALKAAVSWATQGGLDRMRLDTTPEKPLRDYGVEFVAMTSDASVTMNDLEDFASAHPLLPGNMNEWEDGHYQAAVETFLAVEDKGGVAYAIVKAREALSRSQASSAPESEEGSSVPDTLVHEADMAINRADLAGMLTAQHQKDLRDCVEAKDEAGFTTCLDRLKQEYLAHQAKKGGGPDGGQTSAL